MSIIFHEGLPRSGKSYDAVVLLVELLKQGRDVDAYIEGLDFEKLAGLAELPLDVVKARLQQLTADQVKEWYRYCRRNAFIFLDELQDFFPAKRQPLTEEQTRAITQHGHEGQDICAMGQDLRDVHSLWRRRVQLKKVYHKLDAVGAEKRFNVTTYRAVPGEKFIKVSSEIKAYDPRFFGAYKSHSDEGVQTANYKDDKANLRNTFFFKWGLPLSIVAALWGAWTVYKFFSGGATKGAPLAGAAASAPVATGPASQAAPGQVPKLDGPAGAPAPVKRTFVQNLNDRYRGRLAMLYSIGRDVRGVVEWWDGDQVRERLTFDDLKTLGAVVLVFSGSIVQVEGVYVTMWPLKAPGGGTVPSVAPVVPLVGTAIAAAGT